MLVMICPMSDNRPMFTLLKDRQILSWALYDWANSAFATTVVAGFFPVFYSALSEQISTEDSHFWFNVTLAVSSLIVALAAPLLGAIADQGGWQKKFLASFAMLGILMCLALAWVGAGMWWMALIVYGLGQIGFAGANIFYDAMIVQISSRENVDVVSGIGYALGYFGGGILFLLNVAMVTNPQWFGMTDVSTALSVSFISVAVWWFVFSLPLLLNLEKQQTIEQKTVLQSVRSGIHQLKSTFIEIRKLRNVFLFLVSYWLYIDGVGTIYRMAVFFADRILGLPMESLISALILTQFVAFPSALFFGWLGKVIGAKQGIFIGLIVYIMVIVYAWGWLESGFDFYLLAVAIGLVQGGVQSLSRSLFARLVPDDQATEFFGFFNMAGKFAGILGPIIMAAIPLLVSGSTERDSILGLIILFVLGGVLLVRVTVAKGTPE